jgi:hypothetical protein
MDRRLRVLGSKGLVESGLIPRLDGASFTAMRSQFWGQPRWEWCGDHLGPLDAWKYGSHFRDARRKRVPSPPATTGKVIELSDVSSGLASMANLAKGTIIAPDRSRFRGDNPERIAWLREQAIDLIAYARADNGDEGVAGYDMAAAKIDNRRFDALDATEAQHALGQIKKNPPFTLMSTKRELPVTYVIRTRAGTVGVLQIEDVRSSQAPTVFRLRYKLFDTP